MNDTPMPRRRSLSQSNRAKVYASTIGAAALAGATLGPWGAIVGGAVAAGGCAVGLCLEEDAKELYPDEE